MEEKDLALIDQYLQSELSEADRAAFEERMAKEPELARRVAMVKDIALANRLKTDDFRATLTSIAKEQTITTTQETPIRRLPLRWLSVAASVLLLLAAAYFLWPSNGSTSGADLFAANFEPYPNNITARNSASTALANAMGLYDAGQYTEAAQSFVSLINSNPTDTLHFYGGLSFLADRQLVAAQQQLQVVAMDDSSIYQAQAMWYLALSFLQEENITEAKRMLQQLIENEKSASFARKANELLQQLK